MSTSLESTLEMAVAWKKELSEKMCPLVKGPCLQDKCWRFQKDELVAWAEQTAQKDKVSKRLKILPTGKVILGTIVECKDSIFPNKMVLEAKYALDTEARLDLKTMDILNPDGSIYGGMEEDKQIMSIAEMDKDEDQEAKREIDEPLGVESAPPIKEELPDLDKDL